MGLENAMFCYQCEQTFGGKGCTKSGVCGKTPEIANLQDLLIYQLKGISCYAKALLDQDKTIDEELVQFVENALFTTLTNVNFDVNVHIRMLKQSQKLKERIRSQAPQGRYPAAAVYNLSDSKEAMLRDAVCAGIMYDQSLDADIRSLRSTILYGLKGISAYGHQARLLNYRSREVDHFYFLGLEATTNDALTVEELIRMTLRTGNASVEVMRILDEANTGSYENPSPHSVTTALKKGPFIIVSGHDLRDLEMLLQQTEGKGINIYTHGEMLPAHGYPGLKSYRHLAGNYGSAWQNQQKEFDSLPGCILMTTNCLMRPRETYKDRLFTTNVVGWEGVSSINAGASGVKDFSPIIDKALELGGFAEDQPAEPEILVGFGHHATLSQAEVIVSAVKTGKLRHFFLIGGCDGARPGRNYYTDLAQLVPEDCIILTLACGKYRFNKLDFGTVAGLPRLLDIGQCNDAYSAVRIATALADAFDTDVNSLPLSIVLSWYEQKAVADLLALLSLGMKGMLLGPSLPAFLSPNVLQYLVETFAIKPISTPEDDLKTLLKQAN
ncbi:MAG: hydroxylamine reductase [Sporomusaceae bacterium]|nr:hydroxylamine reductase [Sporomusaceae bacterium]